MRPCRPWNANILRIALGIGELFGPLAMLASYSSMGIAIWVSRTIAPPMQGAVADPVVQAGTDNDSLGAASDGQCTLAA